MQWRKPVENYGFAMTYGANLLGTEGDEWKRHRKIANPAFSEVRKLFCRLYSKQLSVCYFTFPHQPNNKFVFDESVRITHDFIAYEWKNVEEVVENPTEICVLVRTPFSLSPLSPLSFTFADILTDS